MQRESCCCTNTPYDLIRHLYTTANYKKRMLILFPPGLGDLSCWHIPEAWAGLVPKDGLSWGWWNWGGCTRQWALPHGLGMPVPLCTGPQPQDRGSSCSETMPTAPKGYGASELKELWKSPWAPCLLVLGFQPPASFLGVSPPMDESTLYIVVLKELGFVQGKGEGRRNGTQALGVSPVTFHSDNPGAGLSLRLWSPQ